MATMTRAEVEDKAPLLRSLEKGAQPPHAPLKHAEIVVVGAGVAGAAVACLLGRAGYDVVLADLHAEVRPDFRVEKLGADQIEMLERLGLLEGVTELATPFWSVVNVHRGHLIDRTDRLHYGISYSDLVVALRRQMPDTVRFLISRIADIQTGDTHQRVVLGDGRTIDARLIVLATGLGSAIRSKLGITRRVLHEHHSTTFGFTIEPSGSSRFTFPSLVAYGEDVADAIDYLSLFPLGDAMRANLFTFLDRADPRVQAFRQNPEHTLLGMMPGLRSFLGSFRVVDAVATGIMSLWTLEGHRQSGVVVVGDAFQTSCPAAGTGVSRLLTDVDRLCNVYVAAWLATPGMGADKIAAFYDDPDKRAADANAAAKAAHRRALTTDASLRWTLRRGQHLLRRRMVGWLKQHGRAVATAQVSGG